MTLKLVEGSNQIDVRLKQKSANNNYLFTLRSKNDKGEYTYNVVDLNTLSMFARFVFDITNLDTGEYVYSVIDVDNYICREGLAFVSYTNNSQVVYEEENNNYIIYGKE